MISSLKLFAISLLAVSSQSSFAAEPAARKNVLWIYLEDVSGWFGCYGDTVIETPNIDALAGEGIRFDMNQEYDKVRPLYAKWNASRPAKGGKGTKRK